MDKLEELMQKVMRVIERQGFIPDAVDLKVKVGENTYSVKWKKPVIYDFDFLQPQKKRRKKDVRGDG